LLRRPWRLVVLGAVAAGLAARLRRVPRPADPLWDDTGERETTETLDHSIAADARHTGSVAVAERPAAIATQGSATLVDVLSPQARLARDDELDHESGSAPETCEIVAWRGYVKWQFHARSQPPAEESFFSPYFRSRGRAEPEQTAAARLAYAELVEKLIAAGWAQDGRGEQWFSARFRR
jgi:hypothetical protein